MSSAEDTAAASPPESGKSLGSSGRPRSLLCSNSPEKGCTSYSASMVKTSSGVRCGSSSACALPAQVAEPATTSAATAAGIQRVQVRDMGGSSQASPTTVRRACAVRQVPAAVAVPSPCGATAAVRVLRSGTLHRPDLTPHTCREERHPDEGEDGPPGPIGDMDQQGCGRDADQQQDRTEVAGA